jgi:hypothetical protein
MRSQAILPFRRPVLPALEPLVAAPANPLLRRLRESLGLNVSSATELIHKLEKKQRPSVPTMLGPLDRVLGGGLERGKLTELVGRRSSGRFGGCLAALAAVTSCGEAAALVDLGDHLDPQLANAAGVDLPRLLWVRPESVKEAVSAAEMLVATGFPLVVIDLGVRIRGRRVADASWVRLARSAESFGAALLISSPFHITGTAAATVISAHSGHAIWKGHGKSPRLLARIDSTLTLEKHRRVITGRSEQVQLRYDEAILEPDSQAVERPVREITAASA